MDKTVDDTKFYVKNKFLFVLCVLFGVLFIFEMLGMPILPVDKQDEILSYINFIHGELEGLTIGLVFVLTAILFFIFGMLSIGEKNSSAQGGKR